MDALTRYSRAKKDIEEAQAFAAKLSAGAVTDVEVQIKVAEGNERIRVPDALKNALQAQVEKKADRIIADAITAMSSDLAKIAQEAVAEFRALAAAAGVTLPGG